MKNICVLLTNDYAHDSRVKKECQSLSKQFNVDLFCLTKDKTEDIIINNNYTVHRIYFKYKLNKLNIYFFSIAIFLKEIFKINKKYDYIWANDIDTIKIGASLKKLMKSKLIYDSHEYWKGYLGGYGFLLELYKNIYIRLFLNHEKKYIKKCDFVFTVNEFIASELGKLYNLKKVNVLYNIPKYVNLISIKNNKKDIVYVGKVNNKNYIKELLKHTKVYHYGIKYNLESKNYIYKGYIPEENIIPELIQYGVGLVTYTGANLEEKYASPNKFFQYLQAGLPVMVNEDSYFLSNFVKKNNVGISYNNINIYSKYIELLKKYDFYRKNVLKSKKIFSWEKEESKLLNILK